jgi:ribonuclease T1
MIPPGNVDRAVEEIAMRQHGLLGRGSEMGNALYAIDIAALPPEAQRTIELIAAGGPFPYPQHDGHRFGNRFGDLPSGGEYLEFTVPTPGLSNRGKRRIVARRSGILFFTACHYERVQGAMPMAARIAATELVDAQWRNGFYVITGASLALRNRLAAALRALP